MPVVTIELERRQMVVSCKDIDEAELLYGEIMTALDCRPRRSSLHFRTNWGAEYRLDPKKIVGVVLQPTSPAWVIDAAVEAGVMQGKAQARVNAALQKMAVDSIVPVKILQQS